MTIVCLVCNEHWTRIFVRDSVRICANWLTYPETPACVCVCVCVRARAGEKEGVESKAAEIGRICVCKKNMRSLHGRHGGLSQRRLVRVRMRVRVRVNEFPCMYLPRKGSVKWRNMLCPFVIKGQQPCWCSRGVCDSKCILPLQKLVRTITTMALLIRPAILASAEHLLLLSIVAFTKKKFPLFKKKGFFVINSYRDIFFPLALAFFYPAKKRMNSWKINRQRLEFAKITRKFWLSRVKKFQDGKWDGRIFGWSLFTSST